MKFDISFNVRLYHAGYDLCSFSALLWNTKKIVNNLKTNEEKPTYAWEKSKDDLIRTRSLTYHPIRKTCHLRGSNFWNFKIDIMMICGPYDAIFLTTASTFLGLFNNENLMFRSNVVFDLIPFFVKYSKCHTFWRLPDNSIWSLHTH